MCVKIVTANEEISYDMAKPLEEQIKGCKKIVINYEPKDTTLDKFLDEVERLCKNGVSAKLNISFNHKNHLSGAKIKKEMSALTQELDLNEVIKLMATTYGRTDKKLEEMANYCMDGNCRVKSKA